MQKDTIVDLLQCYKKPEGIRTRLENHLVPTWKAKISFHKKFPGGGFNKFEKSCIKSTGLKKQNSDTACWAGSLENRIFKTKNIHCEKFTVSKILKKGDPFIFLKI